MVSTTTAVAGVAVAVGVGALVYLNLPSITKGKLQERILPSTGGPGTQFVLSGSGFPPNTVQTFIVTGPGGIITVQSFPVPIDANGNFVPVSIHYSTNLGAGIYKLVWANSSIPSLTYTQI
jgi:hypothetical protein